MTFTAVAGSIEPGGIDNTHSTLNLLKSSYFISKHEFFLSIRKRSGKITAARPQLFKLFIMCFKNRYSLYEARFPKGFIKTVSSIKPKGGLLKIIS